MKNTEILTTLPQLRRLVLRMSKIHEFAFDTEDNTLMTRGLNNDFKLVDISISWGEYDNYLIPIGHVFEEDQLPLDEVVRHLKPIFERRDIRLIGQDLAFDMHCLARVGIEVKTNDLFDTQIASWICNENEIYGLDLNANRLLGKKAITFSEVISTVTTEDKKAVGMKGNQKATFDLVSIENGAEYALEDAFFTWELYLYFLDELEKEEMDRIFEKVYIPLVRTVYNMGERGITVDLKTLEKMGEEMQEDIDQLQYDIYEIAGIEFNPGSSQQLAELLFSFDGSKVFKAKPNKKTGDYDPIYKNPNYDILEMGFNFPIVSTTPLGAPQSSNHVLEFLAKKDYKTRRKREGIELVNKLLVFSKLAKLKTAFVDGIINTMYDDGKVHPSFNIVGTTSGRFSCSKPNMQQMPKARDDDKYQIRDMFIGSVNDKTGERNKIISADYKNLEMRVTAHFSKDELLLKMFENDDDAHGSTAVNMFELDCKPNEAKEKYPLLREVGKTINFLLAYGGGANALYDTLKSKGMNLDDEEHLREYNCKQGIEVAQAYIDKYFDTYSGVSEFMKNQKRFAKRNEFVYTVLGRKRRLTRINGSDFGTAMYEERLALNQPIQGSAGDIMNSAMNRLEGDKYLVRTLECRLLLQIHDEFIFECPEENVEESMNLIRHYMENPFGDNKPLNLPFTVDINYGDSYQEAK